MAFLKTHLQALEDCTAANPSLPIYKLPVYDNEGSLQAWLPVTFSQFKSDVEHFAAYLAQRLQADGVPPRSVVGLWYVAPIRHILEKLTAALQVKRHVLR